MTESRRTAGPRGSSVLTNLRQQPAQQGLESAREAAQAPLQRIEHDLHAPVAFGFPPVRAGQCRRHALRRDGDSLAHPVTLGVILGLVIGKPLGITLFAWLAVQARLAELPAGSAASASPRRSSWLA